MSVINDLDGFYENCTLMAIKTCNNQDVIDNMPFWKYIKLQKALNKYLDAEAKQNGANTDSDNMQGHMDNMKSSTTGMMNNMKSSMKMPKMKL